MSNSGGEGGNGLWGICHQQDATTYSTIASQSNWRNWWLLWGGTHRKMSSMKMMQKTVVGSSWKEWSSVLANSIVRSHSDHHTCHVLLRIILLHIFFISFAELVISCLPSSCLYVCTCLQWISFPSWFFWVRLSIVSLLTSFALYTLYDMCVLFAVYIV